MLILCISFNIVAFFFFFFFVAWWLAVASSVSSIYRLFFISFPIHGARN